MDKAFQTYSILKEEVKHWQDERGSFWTERLSPVKAPPYYPIKELPEEAVLELCQRLNQVSDVIVSDSVLWETWNKLKASQLVTNTELLSRMQIALGGVAQLYRRTIIETEMGSESRSCPICDELAGVSVISPPTGKRSLHCSMCGHEWLAKRIGCVRCGSEEASKLHYLNSVEYPGIEMIVCQTCRQYSKEYDFRVKNVEDLDWDNIRTLPLDFAAEKWLAEDAVLSGKVQ